MYNKHHSIDIKPITVISALYDTLHHSQNGWFILNFCWYLVLQIYCLCFKYCLKNIGYIGLYREVHFWETATTYTATAAHSSQQPIDGCRNTESIITLIQAAVCQTIQHAVSLIAYWGGEITWNYIYNLQHISCAVYCSFAWCVCHKQLSPKNRETLHIRTTPSWLCVFVALCVSVCV